MAEVRGRVRIGGASAFYGDSQLAARQLVEHGQIDYLVFDYLAEATMAILARARARNDALGYAVDFVTVAMRDVLADCVRQNIKIVANAGGVNVPACIDALQDLAAELGLNVRIAGVYGDDLSDRTDALPPLPDIRSGAPLPARPASINAYLGARPIADALAAGADIVVTGRVVDSAVTLGPLMHEFGWRDDDFDRLAQGALAGHVIECGAQCCGGNFTDWQDVPDFSNMSYPIAEVESDGSFVITLAPGTGGLVTPATVGEQILYEIGDPANYRLPDVACDFSAVTLSPDGADRVRVEGARGHHPGSDYKVCVTWIDGYRLLGSVFMAGIDVVAKARCSMESWVQRTRRALAQRGFEDYRDVCIEIIGAEDTYGPNARRGATREVMAKFGLHHDRTDALAFAAAEMAYLATSAAPGMSGFGAGRARPQPLMRVHSAMLAKSAVPVTIQLDRRQIHRACYDGVAGAFAPARGARYPTLVAPDADDWIEEPLQTLAWARSGDKGNDANIGVMARRPEWLGLIANAVTADAVAAWFGHLLDGPVTRFDLPGFHAFNFVLEDALGGGATASLRVDSQGKAFAQMLLSLPVRCPRAWVSESAAAQPLAPPT